jgi:hypothetical protein
VWLFLDSTGKDEGDRKMVLSMKTTNNNLPKSKSTANSRGPNPRTEWRTKGGRTLPQYLIKRARKKYIHGTPPIK